MPVGSITSWNLFLQLSNPEWDFIYRDAAPLNLICALVGGIILSLMAAFIYRYIDIYLLNQQLYF